MYYLIKKSVIFFTISIFISLLIIILPPKKNIHINLYAKSELLFENREVVNLGFENQKLFKYFESNHTQENQKEIKRESHFLILFIFK